MRKLSPCKSERSLRLNCEIFTIIIRLRVHVCISALLPKSQYCTFPLSAMLKTMERQTQLKNVSGRITKARVG